VGGNCRSLLWRPMQIELGDTERQRGFLYGGEFFAAC
jgi:hypothetical protein